MYLQHHCRDEEAERSQALQTQLARGDLAQQQRFTCKNTMVVPDPAPCLLVWATTPHLMVNLKPHIYVHTWMMLKVRPRTVRMSTAMVKTLRFPSILVVVGLKNSCIVNLRLLLMAYRPCGNGIMPSEGDMFLTSRRQACTFNHCA